MWFGSSVVERRNGIPEVLGSNHGRAPVTYVTTCYILRPPEITHIMIGYCFGTLRTFHNVSLFPEFGPIFLFGGGICSRVQVFGEANRHVVGSSEVECRNGIPEALGLNPSRARFFFKHLLHRDKHQFRDRQQTVTPKYDNPRKYFLISNRAT